MNGGASGPPRNAKAARVAPAASENNSKASPNPSTIPTLPFAIVIVAGDRRITWGHYPTRAAADDIARRLRVHGFDARVIDEDVEKRDEPEHRGDRRRFLIAMLMLGAIPPARVAERIIGELEGEA